MPRAIDPAENRKAAKAAQDDAGSNSFEGVAREWFAKQKTGWVESHASRILLRLENDAFPWLGTRPIDQITPKELLAALHRIVDRGADEDAHGASGSVVASGADHSEGNPAP